MATYYIRKTGSDSNAGTSAGAAFQTIAKAIGASGSATSGDTVYVGAGLYRESITVGVTPASTLSVFADLDGAQTGDAGPVQINGAASDFSAVSAAVLPAVKLNGKSNLLFQGFELVSGGTGSGSHNVDGTVVTGSTNITIRKCTMLSSVASGGGRGVSFTCSANVNCNLLIDQCIFVMGCNNPPIDILLTESATSDYDAGITIQNCLLMSGGHGVQIGPSGSNTFFGGGVRVFNCTYPITSSSIMRVLAGISQTYPCVAYGNLSSGLPVFNITTTGQAIEDYTAMIGTASSRTNIPIGANSCNTNLQAIGYRGQSLLEVRNHRPYEMPSAGSPSLGMGTISGNTLPPGTTADDATVGTITWTTPDNAKQVDGTSTTCVLTSSAVGHYLKLTNFGFAVPGGATIIGVMVDILRSGSTATAADNSIRLVKGGTISGTDHSVAAAVPITTLTWASYGNLAGGDLWGLSLTPSDVNGSTFGVAISLKNTSGTSVTASIDGVRITVFYTAQITTDMAGVTRPAGCSVFAAEGTATSGAAKTLTDTAALFASNNALADYQVKIKAGTGSGQVKVIRTNTLTVLTVDGNWVTTPDNTSTYVVYRGPMATSGKATAGSTTTMTDTNAAWATNQWAGFVLNITAGTGSGQITGILSNTATVITFQGLALSTGLDSTSQYSIYKAPGASITSVNDTPGALCSGNTGIANSSVVHSGSRSLRLFGPSYHDLSFPVDATATTVTVNTQYDSEYAGTLPQIQVLNGTECGVTSATTTHTGAVSTWQALALTFTPTAKGIVTIRLLNNSTTPTGSAYFDA